MEINPKFWGSCDLALEAGVNFPKAIIDIHLGKKIQYSEHYEYPFKYHWPLNDDILHGIKNPKKILDIFRDTLNPSVRSNIWLKDFNPNFKLFLDFIKKSLIEVYRSIVK